MGIKNLDVYHWLITTSILSLVLVILSSYVLVNLIFALVYFLIGPQNFGGLDAETSMQQFINLFFLALKLLLHWATDIFTLLVMPLVLPLHLNRY